MADRKSISKQQSSYDQPQKSQLGIRKISEAKMEGAERYFHADLMLIANNGMLGPQQIMLLFSVLGISPL